MSAWQNCLPCVKIFSDTLHEVHVHGKISHAWQDCFTCVKNFTCRTKLFHTCEKLLNYFTFVKKFHMYRRSFRIIFTCILKIPHVCESLLYYFHILVHMVSVCHMLFTYSSHEFQTHTPSSVMKALFAYFLAEKSVPSLWNYPLPRLFAWG